jgi:hypothetical protein
MRDIDDIEHAKRDRDSGGNSGIEAAEQQPGDNRAYQKIDGYFHAILDGRARAYNVVGISPLVPCSYSPAGGLLPGSLQEATLLG